MPTREAVMTALLNVAATATDFKTVSRRVALMPGAPKRYDKNQPACSCTVTIKGRLSACSSA